MRHHLALIVLIVAVIVGLFLLRATKRERGQAPKPVARAQEAAPAVVPPSEMTVPPLTPLEPTVSKSPAAVQGLPSTPQANPPKRNQVIVQAMEGAVIVLAKTKEIWETYETSELKPNKEGRAEFGIDGREIIMLYSYKPGANIFALTRPDSSDQIVRLDYRPSTPVGVACVRNTGSPLEGAEVSVQVEVEMASRSDLQGNYIDSTWVKIPARHAVTNSEGRCGFEGLPTLGWIGIGRGRIPGCRFTINAKWEGLTAELKFDGFPKGEVRMVFD